MMIRNRRGNVWNGVPRDIAFVIFRESHWLNWIDAHSKRENAEDPKGPKRQRLN